MDIEITCEVCAATFAVKPYREKTARFCSRTCGGSWHASTRLARIPKPWNIGNKYAAGHGPNATSFKHGERPWNFGLKGVHFSPATEWKTGHQSPKKMPVGSVTFRADKTGRIRAHTKVADPNVWRLRAVVVWESVNGPVQAGFVIHHEDRDTLNDAIDNLKLMSRADHAREHRRDRRT